LVSGPAHATSFTLNPNGTFSYVHNGDSATSDSFTYRAFDGTNQSGIATVTITINPVVTAPEVTVLGNSVSIADGDTTPSAADFTDFGSVLQGGAPVIRSFTVRNDGTATLNLSGLVAPAGFTITDPLAASLAPGASDTITVQLETATTGTKSGQISFTTDDGDENPFNFNITGTVAPAGSNTTVSFQEGVTGYSGTTDSRIRSDNATKNYGDVATLEMHGSGNGSKTSLIRWNVGSIPTDAVVQSATITFNVTNLSNQTYSIYGLLRDWVEGQVTWNQASTGGNWTTPGGDRDSTVLGTITAPATGLRTITLNAAGIALVQSWISSPATNRGITILNYAATDGLDVDSSEATTATNRPKLTITYSAGSPLLAAATAPVTSSSRTIDTHLTQASLDGISHEAAARLLASVPASAQRAVLATLDTIHFEIADLPGQTLGLASGHTILIDRNAAGFGWFVDSTPRDDREFGPSLVADANSPAYGRMDLLSVVAHEMGHVLGYDHDSELDVMHETLEAGHRASPDLDGSDGLAIDAFFAGIGSASHRSSLNPFASARY
jgi:hypothetical protein